MYDKSHEASKKTGAGSRARTPISESTASRRAAFECCGFRMDDSMAPWDCRAVVRRHPILGSAILGVAGLAVVLIPVGAILGIVAFLRTI